MTNRQLPLVVRNPRWAEQLGPHEGVTTLDELHRSKLDDRVLICFASGLIIPPSILNAARAAYNFHGASPEFPGRDPHHWAIYRGAVEFGVTCHIMTEQVDAGPICAVERFPIPPGTRPRQLLSIAEVRLVQLYNRMLPLLLGGKVAPIDEHWGHTKTTRNDFLAMCRLTPDISQEEFDRRYFAFDGEGFNNMYMEMYGHRWRISPD